MNHANMMSLLWNAVGADFTLQFQPTYVYNMPDLLHCRVKYNDLSMEGSLFLDVHENGTLFIPRHNLKIDVKRIK